MQKTLRDEPQPIVEGWSMHLYCKFTAGVIHDVDTWGVELSGHSRAGVRAEAKRRGWLLHRDGTATCPTCARTGKDKS